MSLLKMRCLIWSKFSFNVYKSSNNWCTDIFIAIPLMLKHAQSLFRIKSWEEMYCCVKNTWHIFTTGTKIMISKQGTDQFRLQNDIPILILAPTGFYLQCLYGYILSTYLKKIFFFIESYLMIMVIFLYSFSSKSKQRGPHVLPQLLNNRPAILLFYC